VQFSAAKGNEMAPRLLSGLAVFAMFVCSAKADVYESAYGPLYFPDGATITSVGAVYLDGQFNEQLDYSFGDGTGVTDDPVVDSDVGSISFSAPVTSVTFGFTSDSEPFNVTFYGPSGAPFETFSDAGSGAGAFSGVESLTFDTDVTRIFWILGAGDTGFGGITSLSYTEAPAAVSTPEPASILLVGIGLMALLGFKRSLRRHSAPQQTVA
jgi:hypothetical protein